MAAHGHALARLAGAGVDHFFMRRYRLFEGGRWPLGVVDGAFHLFAATGATFVGDPPDGSESERIEWVGLDRLRDEVRAGDVRDGLTLSALLWWFAFGRDSPRS